MNENNKLRDWLLKINKKYNRIRVAILYTIVAVSLGISIWALCIANSDVRNDCEMVYNHLKATELAGLIFTVIGAVFSFYFVIIGINANKMKKDLEELEKKLKNEQQTIIDNLKNEQQTIIDNLKNEQQTIIDDLKNEQQTIIENIGNIELEHQDTMYSHLILQAKAIADEKMRTMIYNSLRLSRARLATKSKILPLELRKQRISDLVELGEQSDIEDLKRIIKDPNEDDEIKDLAIGIIPLIEEKPAANKQNQQDKTAGVTNH